MFALTNYYLLYQYSVSLFVYRPVQKLHSAPLIVRIYSILKCRSWIVCFWKNIVVQCFI